MERMFSACAALSGRSLVEAIKAGLEEDVELAAAAYVARVE